MIDPVAASGPSFERFSSCSEDRGAEPARKYRGRVRSMKRREAQLEINSSGLYETAYGPTRFSALTARTVTPPGLLPGGAARPVPVRRGRKFGKGLPCGRFPEDIKPVPASAHRAVVVEALELRTGKEKKKRGHIHTDARTRQTWPTGRYKFG